MTFTPPANGDATDWAREFMRAYMADELEISEATLESAFSQAFISGYRKAQREQSAVDAQDKRTHLAAKLYRESLTANG